MVNFKKQLILFKRIFIDILCVGNVTTNKFILCPKLSLVEAMKINPGLNVRDVPLVNSTTIDDTKSIQVKDLNMRIESYQKE